MNNFIFWIVVVLLTIDIVCYILIVRAWIKAKVGGYFRIALVIFFLSLLLIFILPLVRLTGIDVPLFTLRFIYLVIHTISLVFLYFQIYKLRR
jgi:hypothetical protein